MSQTRAGRVPDEWGEGGVTQGRVGPVGRGKSRPRILIVNFFSLSLPFFLSVCVSVTEFSEVLPPFFPPPIFSSVRVGG